MVHKVSTYRNILSEYSLEEGQIIRNGDNPLPKKILSARPKTVVEKRLDDELGEHISDLFYNQRAVSLYQSKRLDGRIKEEFDRLIDCKALRTYETHQEDTLIPYRDNFLSLFPDEAKRITAQMQAEFGAAISAI